jgi:hypothetical protein
VYPWSSRSRPSPSQPCWRTPCTGTACRPGGWTACSRLPPAKIQSYLVRYDGSNRTHEEIREDKVESFVTVAMAGFRLERFQALVAWGFEEVKGGLNTRVIRAELLVNVCHLLLIKRIWMPRSSMHAVLWWIRRGT